VAESTDWLNEVVSTLDLSKPFPTPGIGVPPVRRDGRFLYFCPNGPFRKAPMTDRLLREFANLTDATILKFAQRWGPLGLCEQHGYPVLHKESGPCLPRVCGDEFAELVGPWLQIIALVKAILSVRTALDRGIVGDRKDWRILSNGDIESPVSVHAAYHCLAAKISTLLASANVRPFVGFDETRLTMEFGGGTFLHMLELRLFPRHRQYRDWLADSGTLLATIFIQLALAVTAGRGLMPCDACGSLYQPTKAPRAEERHYCPKCGKKTADRIIKRIKRGDSEAEALAKERR
jgi:hypothetical protein